MWLVIGNIGGLSLGILSYAIPVSLLESFLDAFIYSEDKPFEKVKPILITIAFISFEVTFRQELATTV